MSNILNVEGLVVKIGCRKGELLDVYLGLPLGAYHKLRASWHILKERIHKRLVMWKRQYLSEGAKLNLIKSTLSS